MLIEYKENILEETELYSLLKISDSEFEPTLSSRINIWNYSRKLLENAIRFEAYYKDKIVGLVAVYANDPTKENAFITYVYCKKEYRNIGIAKTLIQRALNYLKKMQFCSVSLEVSLKNIAAIKLYKNFGFISFTEEKNISDRIMMKASLLVDL